MSKPMTATPSKRTRARAAPEPVEALAVPTADTRPEPDARELAAGLEARARGRERRERVQVVANPSGPSPARSPHQDEALFAATLQDSLGTTSDAFTQRAVTQIAIAMQRPDADLVASVNAGLAVVAGGRPENEVEAMLLIQMASTNEAALSMLSTARSERTPEAIAVAGGLANKLLRTYALQVEALAKLRRGGEQVMRIEHVHVHAGAQAVIGSVTNAGGGGVGEIQHQAHAQPAIAHAPVSPLRSQDQEREPVQRSGSDERPVSAPRRRTRERRPPR